MTSSHQVIVCKRDLHDTDSNYMLSLRKESGHFYPQILFGSGSEIFKATSGIPVELNKWTHLAGTYTGSILSIYQNGEFQADRDCSPNKVPYKSNADVFIGAYSKEDSPRLDGYLFKGIIDELRISDIARSPGEIRRSAHIDLNISSGQLQLPENRLLPEAGMAGLWNFDEGTCETAGDISGNENHGTMASNGNNWTKGRYGTAFDFDGAYDYFEIPASGSLDFTSELSVEAWVKRDSKDTYDSIAGRLDIPSKIGWNFAFRSDDVPDRANSIYFYYYDLGGNRVMYETGQRIENVGQWQHISLSFKAGSHARIYINGIEDNGIWPYGGGSANIHDWNTANLRIGADRAVIQRFDGILDEVAIYDRALSSREISSRQPFHRSGTVIRSETITMPDEMGWSKFQATRSVPQNTFLEISVHDALDDETLMTDNGSGNDITFDLSSIDSQEYDEIYLKARLQSSKTETSILKDWALNWSGETPEVFHPPQLTESVPSNFNLNEDTPEEDILDLADYFNDIYSNINPSVYALELVSDTGNITLELDGSNLDVTYLKADWTGSVSVVANCTNTHGLSCRTNTFNITVINVNDPPSVELLSPAAGSSVPGDTVELYWKATDVDNDEQDLTFDLYFGTNETPSLHMSGITRTDFTISGLENGAVYYWYVKPNDGSIEGNCLSGNWNFGINFDIAYPEGKLIEPLNGSVISETSVYLSWEIIDELDETINYHVFLGLSRDSLSEIGTTEKNWFLVEDLETNKTYYWKVIPATPTIQGKCLSGIWEFTVEKGFTAIYNITAETEVKEINGTQGMPINFNITLGNHGNVPIFIVVEITGISPDLLEFANNLSLRAGNTRTVNVNITNTSALSVGLHQIVIQITSLKKIIVFSLLLNITAKQVPIDDDDDDVVGDDTDDDGTGGDDLERSSSKPWVWIIIGIVIILAIIAVLLIIIRKRRESESDEEDDDEEYQEEVVPRVNGEIKGVNELEAEMENFQHKGKAVGKSAPLPLIYQVTPTKRHKNFSASASSKSSRAGGYKKYSDSDFAKASASNLPTLEVHMTTPQIAQTAPQVPEVQLPVFRVSPASLPIPEIYLPPDPPSSPELAAPPPPPDALSTPAVQPPLSPPTPLLPAAPAEPALEAVPPNLQSLIPGYILTHKLGSGGFATVYRGVNQKGLHVAVKVPKHLEGTVDMKVLENFKAESEIWRKLKHKNIVNFYKGDIRPVPYMVIEYMEGGNLLKFLKGEPLPMDKALTYIEGILSGLAYAHRMASVHRDIKPENILFTKDDVPKISDWGIGKFMASESVSKTIGTKGTLIYSAPEQVSQERYGEVDWSTDVFQIGIVFYEILTGRNPFAAPDPIGIINKIVNDNPPRPSSLRWGIPPEIDNIIMRSLEKRKENRYNSADVMLHEMKRVLKEREKNLEHYKSMLKNSMKAGTGSAEQDAMLEGFRERYGISMVEHSSMMMELMGISV